MRAEDNIISLDTARQKRAIKVLAMQQTEILIPKPEGTVDEQLKKIKRQVKGIINPHAETSLREFIVSDTRAADLDRRIVYREGDRIAPVRVQISGKKSHTTLYTLQYNTDGALTRLDFIVKGMSGEPVKVAVQPNKHGVETEYQEVKRMLTSRKSTGLGEPVVYPEQSISLQLVPAIQNDSLTTLSITNSVERFGLVTSQYIDVQTIGALMTRREKLPHLYAADMIQTAIIPSERISHQAS